MEKKQLLDTDDLTILSASLSMFDSTDITKLQEHVETTWSLRSVFVYSDFLQRLSAPTVGAGTSLSEDDQEDLKRRADKAIRNYRLLFDTVRTNAQNSITRASLLQTYFPKAIEEEPMVYSSRQLFFLTSNLDKRLAELKKRKSEADRKINQENNARFNRKGKKAANSAK